MPARAFPRATHSPTCCWVRISSYGQQDQRVKYYNRYKIVEPYFQDDWHVTSRLTVNLGVRLSLFGTYREKQKQAFNFDPAHYQAGVTTVNSDGTVNNLFINGLPNGIVQCGVTPGVPVSCMEGKLFNPAPRIGFAYDVNGDGKTAIRGGYGMFYEHANGNEGNTESLENSPPLANASVVNNINGYAGTGTARSAVPLERECDPHQGHLALHTAVAPGRAARSGRGTPWPPFPMSAARVPSSTGRPTTTRFHCCRLSLNPYAPGEFIDSGPHFSDLQHRLPLT